MIIVVIASRFLPMWLVTFVTYALASGYTFGADDTGLAGVGDVTGWIRVIPNYENDIMYIIGQFEGGESCRVKPSCWDSNR